MLLNILTLEWRETFGFTVARHLMVRQARLAANKETLREGTQETAQEVAAATAATSFIIMAPIMKELFHKFAFKTSKVVGSPWMFVLAVTVIIVWALTGPLFHFSDTWQLVINTGTTIITFLMVFLIQNTQNRDAEAMHLKLDELIRAVTQARTSLVDLEELSDEELERLQKEFRDLREQEKANHPEPAAPESSAKSF